MGSQGSGLLAKFRMLQGLLGRSFKPVALAVQAK